MYVGGLDEKVSEPLLWELFLQAGPVVNTHMPKDRVTGQHQGECVRGKRGCLCAEGTDCALRLPAVFTTCFGISNLNISVSQVCAQFVSGTVLN